MSPLSSLDLIQQSVLFRKLIPAMALVLTSFGSVVYCTTPRSSEGNRRETESAFRDHRARLSLLAILSPTLCLGANILVVSMYRFTSPKDIHGSGLTTGTGTIKVLRAILQNTLEQACFAVPVYLASSVLLMDRLRYLTPTAALLFLVGRLNFALGYRHGAQERAFGFAATFFPTVVLLVASLVSFVM